MKIIDLSVSIEDDLPCDPAPQIPHIEYLGHRDTVDTMIGYYNGVISKDDLPEGYGWAIEYIKLSSHTGTHLDAPYHFYPTMNGTEPSWTIDEVPLDWCIGSGILMDFHDKPDGYCITEEDLKEYFKEKGRLPHPGDIALLYTGADRAWGTPEYLTAGAGMSASATRWLINQGVKVMGTDGWSWDVPLPLQADAFLKSKDPSIIWEAHRVGREMAYCHIEKLTNLKVLPFDGFQVICLPVKIKGASAGWCRCIAITE